MKATTIIVTAAAVASASAFAPQSPARTTTSLQAGKKSIASRIFDMDLFKDVADQNDYGARGKKKLTTGNIGSNSYVPAGLSAAEYNKVRNSDLQKKNANYARNVAKAGVFEDYTDFYTKRGTDTAESWFKSVTRGHRMVKTKFDWSGAKDEQKTYDGGK